MGPKKVVCIQDSPTLSIRTGCVDNMVGPSGEIGVDPPPIAVLALGLKGKAGLWRTTKMPSVLQSPSLCVSLQVPFHLFGKMSFRQTMCFLGAKPCWSQVARSDLAEPQSLGPSSGLGLVKDPSVFPSPASLGLSGTSWSAVMLSCTREDVSPRMGRGARTWVGAIDLDHPHGMAIPW